MGGFGNQLFQLCFAKSLKTKGHKVFIDMSNYKLGDKKSQRYKESTLELEKLVGDSDKYCKNFLLPKEKTKKGFRLFPIMKNILFRFI